MAEDKTGKPHKNCSYGNLRKRMTSSADKIFKGRNYTQDLKDFYRNSMSAIPSESNKNKNPGKSSDGKQRRHTDGNAYTSNVRENDQDKTVLTGSSLENNGVISPEF